MAAVKIAQLLNTQRRFLRSTHLQRDFRDPGALQGYVITDTVKTHFGRIAGGLAPTSGQRAWRITGDYGSGKSSFALFLALYFAGKDSPLPPVLRRSLDLGSVGGSRQPRFLPVLIVGSREPLAVTVLRAIKQALEQRLPKRVKLPSSVKLDEVLASPEKSPSDDCAIALIEEINADVIAGQHAEGLLIILDELGKFLEFAALHPELQDIYFLQQLAELSTRSGSEPIITIGLLHQGFTAYADQLSQAAQREWEKVAGRYDELLFDQPLDQITHLVRAAMDIKVVSCPRGLDTQARRAMHGALALGWYGAAPAKTSLLETAPGLYPLHPTLIPVLVRLFSRFGQNERSLFSFLLSTEPYGLQDFSQRTAGPETFYRIHNLYDYAAANFGHRLSLQTYRNHWNHIDSLIRSFPARDENEVVVLKTVGLLNLLNTTELLATDEAIVAAVAEHGTDQDLTVRQTIQRLHKDRHVLYLRGRAGGYCLWSHTSVDLEAAYEQAGRTVGQQQRVTTRVKEYLDSRPIVARRHYIQTGNLRHFEVVYCGLQELEPAATQPLSVADGRIVIPLCETPEEAQLAATFARGFTGCPEVLIGITAPLGSLAGLLQEVERWSWVQTHTPELKEDRYAAEEVTRQLSLATQSLEKRIQHYAGLGQTSRSGTLAIQWYNVGEKNELNTSKELLSFLSELCDVLYSKAPRVHNEIINRRTLSSAAASARMRLIERMFAAPDQPLLGMDPKKKPPEMSIYLSLLKAAKLHAEGDATWRLQIPTAAGDPCRLRPTLLCLRELLESQPDARFKVEELFADLRQPPFGVRDGVLPILLVVLLLTYQHEIALYENGTFLSAIGSEEILRLTKVPHLFELQLCRVQGVRRELFEKLTQLMGTGAATSTKADILDVVRPLCRFVAELPEYTRNTEHLELNPRAIRDAILQAREPGALLFRQIPEALGMAPFTAQQASHLSREHVQEYVVGLKSGLDSLRVAFPALLERIRKRIAAAFEVPGTASALAALRHSLSERSQNLIVDLRDIELKAFCLRILDTSLPEADWLESIGSFVANTPPSRWKDADEPAFVEKLTALIQKFRRVETVSFAANRHRTAKATFRVVLTARDGQEQDRVVHLNPEEEAETAALQTAISGLLKDRPSSMTLPALSQTLWKLLEQNNERKT